MTLSRFVSTGRRVLAVCLAFAAISCSDNDPSAPPTLDAITVSIPSAALVMGQTATATATGLDQHGSAITIGTITWSSSATGIATVNATTGVVTAVTAGTADITATAGSKSGKATVTVSAPAGIKVNEVESSGGTPGDWIELYNPTAAVVDISGWVLKDNDDTHSYTFPAGTTIAASGYAVAEEAALGYGLGAPDSARLYNQYGVQIDAYGWTAHATTTYGRCANGTGAFATTAVPTKGAANACGGTTSVAWPGPGTDVATMDLLTTFSENLSGLMYEGGTTNVIWAAVNGGPSKLHRLLWDGTNWKPDAANSWSAGKAVHYTDGTGQPDAEGVTYAGTGSTGGIYISTERNNDANNVNRFSILRYDPAGSTTDLTATHEWNITTELPTPSAVNLGLEGIAWVPDSYLTANHLYDSAAHHEYNPADYADHAGGLFLVGMEANGIIYAYALNHTDGSYTRITSFSMGQTSVMEVSFDRDNQVLWAYCDNGCGNKATTLSIDASSASPTYGRFVVTRAYDPPSSLPTTMNNEGFTFEPESACVGGQKYVFWSDDGDTGGYSLRRAKISCGIH